MRNAPQDDNCGWPRRQTESILTRKRDVVIRVADWTKDKDEPAYDVEVYVHGVYDWNQSQTFSTRMGQGKAGARKLAVEFAADRLAKLVK